MTASGSSARNRVRGGGRGDDRLAWWRQGRFGMFIHWGLYAVPAGAWQGRKVPGIGEWIMFQARIPAAQYEKLADKFNPTEFDADAWVRLAKSAGMKYLVITAKHHDGFAMYDSAVSDYSIVSRTPFGRDPMKELARACRRHGVRLCLYYSQTQDWHHPDAAGNNWDWPEESAKDFERYLRRKARPQVRELLTQYGPIGLIWFDTPQKMTPAQSMSLKRLVRRLQGRCLVSGRVGNDLGDYGSLGDNQVPRGPVKGDWETPATLNDTWGYKSYDHNWKSVGELLRLLVDLASKGVNYLLNVGPTAKGAIPPASVSRLRQMGEWMAVNGQAIYGTSASPFPCAHDWGRITQKPGKLYLHLFDWPKSGSFTLLGLENKVKKVSLLARPKQKIVFEQTHDETLGHVLGLKLPARRPDKHVSVVALDIDGRAKVDSSIVEQPDGIVRLPAHMAELHGPGAGESFCVGRSGIIEGWRDRRKWLSWHFKVATPGRYSVKLTVGRVRWRHPVAGHKVAVSVARQRLAATTVDDRVPSAAGGHYFPEGLTELGDVIFDRPGVYTLKLTAERIQKDAPAGLTVAMVQLVHKGR